MRKPLGINPLQPNRVIGIVMIIVIIAILIKFIFNLNF